jgi:S1-C subfamily serine protease
LIFNNARIQQDQFNALQEALDEAKSKISTVESSLSALLSRINISNQNTLENASELRAIVLALNSSFYDLKDVVDHLLNQSPASIYESAHKSIVMIRTTAGQGSGFLYNSSNLILTNWHVVNGATDIDVEFYDRSRQKATLVGSDAYADVAVIRVQSPPPDAKPLQLGNSSKLWIGQQVVAIGNPLGLAGSLSSGYISQINRRISITDLPIVVPVLQLDITIAPGSSGGPLLDMYGNVVGITNAGTSYGINFAVPSNIVKRVASSIIEKGEYKHPFVGFSGVELNPETIKSMNILNVEPFQTGLLITSVIPDTPAAKAGLRPAVSTLAPDGSPAYQAMDIILSVDGHPTFTFEDWSAYVEEHVSPGQPVTLSLWRSGKVESVIVNTTFRPPYQG